jgi:hypothetical protein
MAHLHPSPVPAPNFRSDGLAVTPWGGKGGAMGSCAEVPDSGSFPHENEIMHLQRVSFSFLCSFPFSPGSMRMIVGRVFALTVSPV